MKRLEEQDVYLALPTFFLRHDSETTLAKVCENIQK